MKKRFLSAALALAMVLTLLPLSVMPASAAGTIADGDTATYYATENTTVHDTDWTGAGWYVTHVTPATSTTAAKTEYSKVNSGFIVGNRYYSSMTETLADGTTRLRSTAFTVIGASQTVALDATTTSVTVDIYNGPAANAANTLLGTSVSFTGGALTSLTVTDSKYATEVNNGIRNSASDNRGTVNIPTFAAHKGITIKLDDVIASGAISLTALTDATAPAVAAPVSNSVTLTNAKVDAVTLGGRGVPANTTNANYTYASQTLNAYRRDTLVKNAPGNEIGAIIVKGNSSSVTLWDTKLTGAVSITGTNTTLTIEGNTEGSGNITLVGSEDSKVKTGAGTVNVNGTSRTGIGKITQGSDQSTSNFAVNVKGSSVVAGIDFENANVTVSNATVKTGATTIKNGFLKLQGGATVGAVTFKADGTVTEFSVTGNGNNVGDVSVASGGNTFNLVNIVAGNTNTFKSLGLGDYAGHGVHGGKYETAITPVTKETDYLDSTMAYRVTLSDNTYTQYFPGTSEGLSQAVAAAGKTNATAATGANIVRIGQTNTKTVTLQNEGTAVAVIGFSLNSAIIMPAVINGVTYDNWTVTENQTDSGASYKPGQEFTALAANSYKLDAQLAAGSVTKITSADNITNDGTENSNVTVKLNGNVITLSGAAKPSGDYAVFKVRLNTDLTNKLGAIKPEININWNPKTGRATFDRNSNPGFGITFPDDNTLRLDNGTIYTVNGSGLKEVEGPGVFTTGTPIIEVTVTDPDYKTQSQKDGLVKLILGTSAGDSSFSYTNSPALNQAVNAAMATITESQVKSWRTQVQRAAWQAKKGNITPTEADLNSTGYKDVELVPYLAITVTNDNPLTMNLVPSYRVVVKNPSGTGFEDVFKNKTTGDADGNYIVKTGTSLGTLSSDLTKGNGTGSVDVKLAISEQYAHQDGSYVYATDSKTFHFLHAGKTAGLGTVVFDNTDAVVELKRVAGAKHADGKTTVAADVTYKYDSLQAAVDDTLPQIKDKEDEITVKSGYTGNGAISVSGVQRIFKVTTNGNTTLSAGASADVRVTDPTSGSTYTVQLLKDNVTSANIIVITAENGLAVANTVSAKPGDKVTVTATPKEGYVVKEVTATTNTGIKVPVTNNGNNTYTFNMPANATRVDVTPVFALAGLLPFNDVPLTANFYKAVEYCYNHNLIQGTTLTTFSPYNSITRGQIVLILYRQAGSPTVSVNYSLFTDMPTHDAEMCRAVTWAFNNKIIEGYPDRTFKYNVAVSRQELATILYNYQTGYKKLAATGSVSSLNGYSDGSATPSWSNTPMRWALGNGIITATGTSLNPYSSAYRYQTAEAMYMYMSGVLGIK